MKCTHAEEIPEKDSFVRVRLEQLNEQSEANRDLPGGSGTLKEQKPRRPSRLMQAGAHGTPPRADGVSRADEEGLNYLRESQSPGGRTGALNLPEFRKELGPPGNVSDAER